jgi:hypothetical protein
LNKLLSIVVLLLSLLGCGVSTSSSPDIISSSSVSDDNGSDINTTIDDANTTVDDNTTDGSGDGSNTISPPPINNLLDNNGIESDFDTTGAVEDSAACELSSDYEIAFKDSSFDPLATENISNGLELGSMLNYDAVVEQTEVAIFAPKLTQTLVGKRINVYGTGYWLGFDSAWVSNAKKTVYIRTPKDTNGYYGCYRYVLNSSDAKAITGTKVYR